MDFKQLQHFIWAVESGSFRKASRKARLGQSGFSSSISSMEKELGFDLFIRESNRTLLTEKGRKFLEFSHEFLDKYKKLRDELRNRENCQSALRIGISKNHGSAINLILDQILQGPFELDILYCEGAELRRLFHKGALDVMIGLGLDENEEVLDIPSEHSIRLLKDRLILIADKNHPFCASKTFVPLKELAQEEFLLTPAIAEELEPYFEDQGQILKIRARFNDATRIARFLQKTRSLALLGEQTIPPSLMQNLSRIPCENFEIPYTIRMYFHPNDSLGNPEGRKWLRTTMEKLLQ